MRQVAYVFVCQTALQPVLASPSLIAGALLILGGYAHLGVTCTHSVSVKYWCGTYIQYKYLLFKFASKH